MMVVATSLLSYPNKLVMDKGSKLDLILERIGPGNGPEAFALWGCRGARKGCPKKKKKHKHCPDCVPCHDMDESLEQVLERINRGDA